ncbi:hypothetical protein BD626DRAFT_480078 [Schizophyllum amplum]|uniref:HIG1 domain-containing protein n=1 Tax=Schizophyllum amplum TaxID=97359 RepID=A0A550CSW0_9AGAR|nr:hypothetical protein BD626DRAFT_480078 [Auriculariopsis ampla]
MKLLTQEQFDAFDSAARRGALEGTVFGGALSFGMHRFALSRYPSYRNLTPSLKLLGGLLFTVPLLAIQAERRGLEYDQSQWVGENLLFTDKKELEARKHWESLSTGQKIKEWGMNHQYSIILGGWAAGIATSSAIIFRNKYQSYPQKVVQVRMWAQGITVALMIAAGVLTANQRQEKMEHRAEDHSWMNVLETREREKQLEQAGYVRS